MDQRGSRATTGRATMDQAGAAMEVGNGDEEEDKAKNRVLASVFLLVKKSNSPKADASRSHVLDHRRSAGGIGFWLRHNREASQLERIRGPGQDHFRGGCAALVKLS